MKYSAPCSCIMKLAFKILTWGVLTCWRTKWERFFLNICWVVGWYPNWDETQTQNVPREVYLLFLMLPCSNEQRIIFFSFFLGLASKTLSRNCFTKIHKQPETMKKPSADMKSSCETAHAASAVWKKTILYTNRDTTVYFFCSIKYLLNVFQWRWHPVFSSHKGNNNILQMPL